MDRISIDAVVEATGGRLIKSCGENYISGVKHDSRECGAGDMFVAVMGKSRDGHEYIKQVLDSGCRTLLVSHTDGWEEETGNMEFNVILVDDTVYAMGELAAFYLESLDLVKIAVTGSVGKTSTRDMIYYVLSEKYSCGRNIKNYNNDIGLPLSVFRFDSTMQVAVLEMGMDKAGEIDRLAEIVKPNIAVITNIGVSHIENLGSREAIFRAKMEVAQHIESRGEKSGMLVFQQDGEFLTKENCRGNYGQIMIGERCCADYIISDIDDQGLAGIKFKLEHNERCMDFELPVPGRHNAVNAALAVAVGGLLGVSGREAQEGLTKLKLTGNRLKVLEVKGLKVIDDTYNASPASMKSAMKALAQSPCEGMRVAILGDMHELGDESDRQHFEVGLFARGIGLDTVITVGERAARIAEGADGGDTNVFHFEKKENLYGKLNQLISPGDIILVKGSRAMEMEQVVGSILKNQELS